MQAADPDSALNKGGKKNKKLTPSNGVHVRYRLAAILGALVSEIQRKVSLVIRHQLLQPLRSDTAPFWVQRTTSGMVARK